QTRRTAIRIAILVFRTKRRTFIATHRANTAGIEVLEDRIALVADPFTVVDFAVQGQRAGREQRHEILVLIGGTVVLRIAGGRNLEVGALIAALGWYQRAVAAVALPCHR